MNTTDIINTPDNIQPLLTLETLPKLLPQQQLMLNYILDGNNYTDAYRKAGYLSVDNASCCAWQMVIRDPLKSWLHYYQSEMAKMCTPQYLTNKLTYIAQQCANDETVHKNGETAIKAIDVINKMQGNYAQTNTTNIQINTSIEDIRNAKQQYIKDK